MEAATRLTGSSNSEVTNSTKCLSNQGANHNPAINPSTTVGSAAKLSKAGFTRARKLSDMKCAVNKAAETAKGTAMRSAYKAALRLPSSNGVSEYLGAEVGSTPVLCQIQSGEEYPSCTWGAYSAASDTVLSVGSRMSTRSIPAPTNSPSGLTSH